MARRPDNQPTVVWNVDVKEDVLVRLAGLLPVMGSRAWAINAGLKHFMQQAEASPRLQRFVHEDVQRKLHEEATPTGLMKTNVRVNRDIFERFNRLFPEWGASTWFTRIYLGALVDYMETKNLNIDQLAEVSVQATFQLAQGKK
jgi:hypothetical protein